MSRRWRLRHLVWLAATVQGCILLSDFTHLDDGPAGQAGVVGVGGKGGGGGFGAAGGIGGIGGSTGGIGAGGAGQGGVAGASGASVTSGGGAACKTQLADCLEASECCPPLDCAMTTAGLVCCGLTGESCKTEKGEDCCGTRNCHDANGMACATPPCTCT